MLSGFPCIRNDIIIHPFSVSTGISNYLLQLKNDIFGVNFAISNNIFVGDVYIVIRENLFRKICSFPTQHHYSKIQLNFNIPKTQMNYLTKMKLIPSYKIVLNTVSKSPKIFEKELVNLARSRKFYWGCKL